MMKALLKKVALAVVPALVLASSASAQTKSWSTCGGSTFNTCASVVLNVLAGNILEVRVQNYSGAAGTNTWANTVFTSIGFDNLAASAVLNIKQGKNFVAGSTT